MYPAIIEVSPKEGYILNLCFESGEKGELDLKPILDFGVFQRIKDFEKFKKVRVRFDTIEWDCGVDLDPEYVYQNCMKVEVV